MHYINTQHLAHVTIGSVLDLVQELLAHLRTCRKRAKTPKGGGADRQADPQTKRLTPLLAQAYRVKILL